MKTSIIGMANSENPGIHPGSHSDDHPFKRKFRLKTEFLKFLGIQPNFKELI